MSKVQLKLDKLKPEALNATGRQMYGMDEYVYIKSFKYDDNNNIQVNFYVLVKVDETTFDLIANISKPDYTYAIADGKTFSDISGNNIYALNSSGTTAYADVEVESIDDSGNTTTTTVSQPVKRENDFTRNFTAFAALIIPSIFIDINNYLGYHENEGGAIDNPE